MLVPAQICVPKRFKLAQAGGVLFHSVGTLFHVNYGYSARPSSRLRRRSFSGRDTPNSPQNNKGKDKVGLLKLLSGGGPKPPPLSAKNVYLLDYLCGVIVKQWGW